MIPSEHSDFKIGHGTHPGETGKQNEDSYSVVAFRSEAGGEIVTLGVIADGVGGNRAGEVASALAVKTIVEAVGRSQERDFQRVLELALIQAAFVLAEESQKPNYYGMGTTCAAALVANRRLYTAYLGDSRLYLIHKRTIRQTSVDHTWVQEAIEHGVITRAEAKNHINRHVVRRHLGRDPDVKPDFRLRLYDTETPEQSQKNQGFLLEPGDRVLLCSDGLSDLVEPEEMLDRLLQHDPQAAVEGLILLARARGGDDNITVIVMQAPD